MAAQPLESTTEVIAHRGFSALYPENTLAAFEAAIACGADCLEFDVRTTRDRVAVVIHDALLDRTTEGRGPVCGLTLAEIRRLDAGSWFHPRFHAERVPALDEVLALSRGRIAVNVEIKRGEEGGLEASGSTPDAGVEKLVVAAIHRHGVAGAAVVSSFERRALERVAALDPHLRRETLYNQPGVPPGLEAIEAAVRSGSTALSVSRTEILLCPQLVSEARARGLAVKVYTVDDRGEMARLVQLGVGGIFTNRPDLLLEVLGRQE